MARKQQPTMGLRAYARHRGCALAAVQKAIDAGRLKASVGRDGAGRPTITNPEVADLEWDATTRTPVDTPDLQAARARREQALAELAELKLAQARGELVEAAEVERTIVDTFTRCRTKLLGLPARVKQQIPHLSADDVATINALVREALEDLATEGAES